VYFKHLLGEGSVIYSIIIKCVGGERDENQICRHESRKYRNAVKKKQIHMIGNVGGIY